MNSSVESEADPEMHERALWCEVIRLALADWQEVYRGGRSNFSGWGERRISKLKQELNWFFFEPKPQECNLAWICANAAKNAEALKEAVDHGLVHGIAKIPFKGRVTKKYRVRR